MNWCTVQNLATTGGTTGTVPSPHSTLNRKPRPKRDSQGVEPVGFKTSQQEGVLPFFWGTDLSPRPLGTWTRMQKPCGKKACSCGRNFTEH